MTKCGVCKEEERAGQDRCPFCWTVYEHVTKERIQARVYYVNNEEKRVEKRRK